MVLKILLETSLQGVKRRSNLINWSSNWQIASPENRDRNDGL